MWAHARGLQAAAPAAALACGSHIHACRAGVGSLTLLDNDVVDLTNVNRQLPATHSTVGRPKAEVMAARITDINPDIILDVKQARDAASVHVARCARVGGRGRCLHA